MKPNSKIASFFSALFINFRHLSLISKIEKVVEKMNPTEKILFYLASAVVTVSGLMLLMQVNNAFLVEVPSFGGSFTEGLVGSPRFINPILAISDTDKDVSSLVYSGLLRTNSDGKIIADLAESFEVNETGTVYDFVLKDNIYFHDNKKVTSDDVVFTINKILDPIIKSPKKVQWEGVTVEKIDDKNIRFILSKPYAPFLNALTVGILPKHVWENASSEEFPFSELNINPVGAGPYEIKKVSKNSSGIPTSINLYSWHRYALGRPKIKSITFKFFQNENDLYKAYEEGSIQSLSGLSPTSIKRFKENTLLNNASLPRVFGVFLNQNIAPVFLNKEVREALDIAAPKQKIIDEVLFGFGKVINGPTPVNIEKDHNKKLGNIEEARNLLIKNGWAPNEEGILEKKTKAGTTLLGFSITTSDAPELKRTAEILAETWRKLGANVDIKVFEAGDLSQNVIKGRKYDALLFGEVVGEESDLYPFWHSSQRNDPGLNISLYANITVDKALEDSQKERDPYKNSINRETILAEIQKDIPAIFLFSPDLLYTPAIGIKNISLKKVSSPSERFVSINSWFIETDKVWKIFTKEKI